MKRKGYSLLEMLIAIAVVTLVMVGALRLISSEWQLMRNARETLFVTRVLESRMEEIRDLSFDQVLSQFGLEEMEEAEIAEYLEQGSLMVEMEFEVDPAMPIFGTAANPGLLSQTDSSSGGSVQLLEPQGVLSIELLEPDFAAVELEVGWDSGGAQGQRKLKSVSYITRNGISKQ